MIKSFIEMIPLNEKSRKKQKEINNLEWKEYCYIKFNQKIMMIMRFIKYIFSFYDYYGNFILEPSETFLTKVQDSILTPLVLIDCETSTCFHGNELDRLHGILASYWNDFIYYRDINILKKVRFILLNRRRGAEPPKKIKLKCKSVIEK